jgi:hypothetical protein
METLSILSQSYKQNVQNLASPMELPASTARKKPNPSGIPFGRNAAFVGSNRVPDPQPARLHDRDSPPERHGVAPHGSRPQQHPAGRAGALARMKGDNALWIPGTDHGGIATQNVVEKLLKKEGKHATTWAGKNFWTACGPGAKSPATRSSINSASSAVLWTGPARASPWTKPVPAPSRRPSPPFSKRGLIYQGVRLVNWCPRCCTALSDIEVEHEERAGILWHIRYPFADDAAGGMIVATTRPETMLGDTAVAVNPDERYAGQAGRMIRLPLMDRRDSAGRRRRGGRGVRHRRGQSDPVPRRHRLSRSARVTGCPTNA